MSNISSLIGQIRGFRSKIVLINGMQCEVIDNNHQDWIVFNVGFAANIRDWNPQLKKQLAEKFNLLLYNYKGIYPYPPYPKHKVPLELSFPQLYEDLLSLLQAVIPGKKPYLLGWSMGATFVYYCVTRAGPNPESTFKGAIVFAGRDYLNSHYPTVGRQLLVRQPSQSFASYESQIIQSLYPRSYLLNLPRLDLAALLIAFRVNYAPLSTEVIDAENAAITEVDYGIVPIRSQWRKMSSTSQFPMIIFHASQDGIVSQQYQEDMKRVLPKQWPINYVTYDGRHNLPFGGHAFFSEQDTANSVGLTTNITTIIKQTFGC